MNIEPISKLTRERPDLWTRALALATDLTGYTYPHKEPLPSGTIYACGDMLPRPPRTKEDVEREIDEAKKQIEIRREPDSEFFSNTDFWQRHLEQLEKELEKFNDVKPSSACTVYVPEGEMEWLLHEVGHWIAATPAERLLPNYGLQDDILGTRAGFEKIIVPSTGLLAEREWQAWGFEEIVLSPYGPSRLLASPTQRDGVAFSQAGPMPYFALHHAEIQMRGLGVDVEEWRSVYGEWVRWSAGRRDTVH